MSTTLQSPSPADASPRASESDNLTVALAGNPNAGKTTLFNVLTGLRQKVANYPGVTVERKEGVWSYDHQAIRLIDIPGLYSLDAASVDEQIARNVITGAIRVLPAPDVIVTVVDATNLERNLYLVTQIIEYGKPVVVALTMMDLAEKRDLQVDARILSAELGVPVVPVVASKRSGINELGEAVIKAVGSLPPPIPWQLPSAAEEELNRLTETGFCSTRADALRYLYSEDIDVPHQLGATIDDARARLTEHDARWWQQPLLARYHWIEGVAAKAVRGHDRHKLSLTDRIDSLLTNRFLGPIILVIVMVAVFQTIFSWANVPMDLIDRAFGALGDTVSGQLGPGLFTDLLVDGVIAGVGGVLVFLPQILLLFFFISILEDTGYMSRAAFIMDRLMRGVGLHGKAFMPLLSSFACAIPGIMATRTIENPKDRIATIMIAPFMSCSARLPIYTLMIAAFFSGRKVFGFISVGALLILGMYVLGILVAICVAWILKHTILKAPTPPLVLELPPYRLPSVSTILHTMFTRSGLFLKRAGTVILAISIILWALATFPRTSSAVPQRPDTVAQSTESTDMDQHSTQLSDSFAGRGGRLLEPLIRPLGFDWKMGVALISSFAARETLVSTLSIIYNVGDDTDASSDSLINAVRNARRPDGRAAWTPLVALSMMVFFVLALQCMSTIAIIRRETNSWKWPLFTFAYMTVLAYTASFITYQGGRLLGFE